MEPAAGCSTGSCVGGRSAYSNSVKTDTLLCAYLPPEQSSEGLSREGRRQCRLPLPVDAGRSGRVGALFRQPTCTRRGGELARHSDNLYRPSSWRRGVEALPEPPPTSTGLASWVCKVTRSGIVRAGQGKLAACPTSRIFGISGGRDSSETSARGVDLYVANSYHLGNAP